jgi:hypothetical protein
MMKFNLSILLFLMSSGSVLGQTSASCGPLNLLRTKKIDSVTVLAEKIASVKVHKGELLKEIALKKKLNINKIYYCAQIVIKGCVDTLLLVSLDNSPFAFNARSKNKNDLFKMRIITFPDPLKKNGNRYLVIDSILPVDKRK